MQIVWICTKICETLKSVEMTVKIFNITHKPCRLFGSDDIVTINAGRSVANSRSKDGNLAQSDLEWLEKNTLSDATGDNISEFNRYCNEMTAIYWVWKNYDKVGNPDFVGFMHYRRHFILMDKLKFQDSYEKTLGLTKENLERLTEQYDLITPPFVQIKKSCISQNFGTLGKNKVREVIGIALDIIKVRYPSDYEKVVSILQGHNTGSFYNMFIMKKELFFEYCEWIFPILFDLDKKLGRDNYGDGQERSIGWTAEMLTSIFIYIKSKDFSHKEVLVFNQDPSCSCTLKNFIIACLKLPFAKEKKRQKYKGRIYNYILQERYGN